MENEDPYYEDLCLECSKVITEADRSPDPNYCAECYDRYQNELKQIRGNEA